MDGRNRLRRPRNPRKHYYANILYVYYDGEFVEERGIYTDDKTTYSSDKDLF